MFNPYAIIAAIAVALGLAWGAYSHGVTSTTDRYEALIAKTASTHKDQVIALQEKVRSIEQAKAKELEVIAENHLKEIEDGKAIADRTIADLRAGTIRLRDKFAANEFARVGLPGPAAGASVDYAAASLQLQNEDAGFLVRFAEEADQVADQLRACQAVVKADRTGAKP